MQLPVADVTNNCDITSQQSKWTTVTAGIKGFKEENQYSTSRALMSEKASERKEEASLHTFGRIQRCSCVTLTHAKAYCGLFTEL